MKSLTTHGAAVIASQEHKARRNLAGLRRPTNGRSELLDGVVVHGGRDERRPDGTRCNSVDSDALADVLIGETTGKGDDGSLGRGIVEKIWTANVGVDGRVVDDCGALLHVRQGVFGEVEEWVYVGVEGVYPLVPFSHR